MSGKRTCCETFINVLFWLLVTLLVVGTITIGIILSQLAIWAISFETAVWGICVILLVLFFALVGLGSVASCFGLCIWPGADFCFSIFAFLLAVLVAFVGITCFCDPIQVWFIVIAIILVIVGIIAFIIFVCLCQIQKSKSNNNNNVENPQVAYFPLIQNQQFTQPRWMTKQI